MDQNLSFNIDSNANRIDKLITKFLLLLRSSYFYHKNLNITFFQTPYVSSDILCDSRLRRNDSISAVYYVKVKVKGKVYPCTGTEALYRLYGP